MFKMQNQHLIMKFGIKSDRSRIEKESFRLIGALCVLATFSNISFIFFCNFMKGVKERLTY